MQNKDKNQGPESAKIRVLVDSVARRIAAGEVIDRPYSVVRELLDNAVDAGSSKIRLDVVNGGIDALTCTDDGSGMDEGDLKLSIVPHATSKIREFEDLYKLSTLGFRGEALSSIAACSKLEILSRTGNSGKASRILVHAGKVIEEGERPGAPGTRVHVENLFYSLPGRKKFLKTAGAEANLCTSAFLEKALPFPEIEFRYFNNGKMKTFLPKGDIKNRVCAAYPRILNPSLVNCWDATNGPYGFSIAGATPSLYRKDRRYIQIYVNKRRINDFALTQAVEYGYSEYLPGGCYPLAFVFITIPPDLVDFNIHPSKKEVRFRDSHGLHRALVGAVKSGLTGYTRESGIESLRMDRALNFSDSSFNRASLPVNNRHYSNHSSTFHGEPSNKSSYPSGSSDFSFTTPGTGPRTSAVDLRDTLIPRPSPGSLRPDGTGPGECRNRTPDFTGSTAGVEENCSDYMPPPTDIPLRYLGQIMNLFLVVEMSDSLYLIDQHAAHERILYNGFLSDPGGKQELLVPFLFELDEYRDRLLQENLEKLINAGFAFEQIGKGRWQMTALPSRYAGMEDEIHEFLTDPKGDYSHLEKILNHSASCRKAVKEGDVLDDLTAVKLAEETFRLPQPRCPHGRPVWFQLSREDLYRLVGRTF